MDSSDFEIVPESSQSQEELNVECIFICNNLNNYGKIIQTIRVVYKNFKIFYLYCSDGTSNNVDQIIESIPITLNYDEHLAALIGEFRSI